MEQTTNYNLKKPALTDPADITELSGNFDIIDEALKDLEDNKADLVDGKVPAAQMPFNAEQVLYVDAAAADGGDGSQASPFKTIQAAINARYRGTNTYNIKIKAGTYNEDVSITGGAGASWGLDRDGTGTVTVKSVYADGCSLFGVQNITFTPGSGRSAVHLSNVQLAVISNLAITGNNSAGVYVSNGNCLVYNTTINSATTAIVATSGAKVTLVSVSGTGNTTGVQADQSMVIATNLNVTATTPFNKVNGGVINVDSSQGANSTFPSNYTPMRYLGNVQEAAALRTTLTAELNKLASGEAVFYQFANNVSGGLNAEFPPGQMMQVQLFKSSDDNGGNGVAVFYGYLGAPIGTMIYKAGQWQSDAPIKAIYSSDLATTESYGLVKLADEAAVLSETDEAAVHVPLMYEINDFRRMNKAYSMGDKVNCAFKHELFLECTQAGTTSNSTLDTRNVTHGQVIADGTAQWTVRTHIKSVNGVVADGAGNVTIEIPEPVIASEAEAKAGTNNTKHMTPLRVAQAIDALDGNPITGASISGKTITLTKKDGSKITLTTQDTVTDVSAYVKVTAGTVAHNGTIPLPSGYSRSQCKYAVWGHQMPDADCSYGSNSYHKVQVDQSTGKVFCQYNYNSNTLNGTAGYLCVAVK